MGRGRAAKARSKVRNKKKARRGGSYEKLCPSRMQPTENKSNHPHLLRGGGRREGGRARRRGARRGKCRKEGPRAWAYSKN